ncbi:MAG: ATP-dependent DNA ligase [Verrucomicrobia bacterium]|nr:ATP-dependent DNA ligase [Verrucomicrobiota bacterium]
MLHVRYDRGVHLPELDLWLDPRDERETAFVSHAHSDHVGNHHEVILSEVTGRLMAARLPGNRLEHRHPFRRPFTFRGAELTLYPAGHIFGSAQLHIRLNDSSLLYTGDFKLRAGRSAEPVEWTSADTLIMETTYGLPQYVFPPTNQVIDQLRRFCVESLEDGMIPILFGYSLGKAQEILACLCDSGLRVALHPSVYRMTRLYEEMRQRLPAYTLYTADDPTPGVLICPPGANRAQLVQKIKNRRTAVLTGWALHPGAIHRYQCDAAFPLSDHADYQDLVRYVELVQPKRVLALHGYAREFAEDLRRRGFEAWSLGEDNQLELPIPVPAPGPEATTGLTAALASASSGAGEEDADSPFGRFTAVCEAISQVTGKLKKVSLLANYLRALPAVDLAQVTVYLTGHAFSRQEGQPVQVGWAIIKRAPMQAARLTEPDLRRLAGNFGDAGRAAYQALIGRTSPRPFTIAEVHGLFLRVQNAPGPMAKADALAGWLGSCSARTGSYLVRILTGDLRIGLREGLVEEAIAEAFNADFEAVREAHMLTGNLGETALLASRGELDRANVTLFRPVKSMLAISEPDGEAAAERIERAFGSRYALAEQKYDGIRAQLHFAEGKTALYSRDLRSITDEFPELTCLKFPAPLILDGEILAHAEGKDLTFFDLQKRLGRKRAHDLFADEDVPVILVAFDLLYLDGRSLLKTPFRERRRALESLALPDRVRVSPLNRMSTGREIEEAFLAARHAKHEGLILKDPDSFYTPGRRGGSWIKLKKEFSTLDVVVVAAEQGHGKRNHVLSDYTFALRDDNSGRLLTIGKAYSGLTDAEIEELTQHFLKTTTKHHGRIREVLPEVVLEIAFDSIQASDRHTSGLALRFPRIKSIRRDKTVADVDTVRYARQLAGSMQAGS